MDGGHGHSLDLGVSLGPLWLRVVLLAAVPVVAGYVLLRGFLAEPGRRTTVAVVATAGVAATLELLLAGGLNLPQQAIPLLLAALVVPMYLLLSRDERFTRMVSLGRRYAPWVFWPVAALATVQFGLAWLGSAAQARFLSTGVLLALVALVWFVVARTRRRSVTLGLRVGAALLATGLIAGVAQAVVLRSAEPAPGVATAASVGPDAVSAVVVPNQPGWNLVHVGADGAAVGTSRDRLVPAQARPGTSGGWVAVELPPGRTELWVRDRSGLGSFTTDAGGSGHAPAAVAGPDGPECASAMLGAMLVSGAAGAECPSDALTTSDAAALRETVDFLAADGHRRLTMVTDQTPRGRSASATVRAAAAARGMAVRPPSGQASPLLVVSGWTDADTTLRGIASGSVPASATYLAPWLLTAPLLAIPAGQQVVRRFDPEDSLFQRYTAALRAAYPGQLPSASGYRAWLGERQESESGEVRLSPTDAAFAGR